MLKYNSEKKSAFFRKMMGEGLFEDKDVNVDDIMVLINKPPVIDFSEIRGLVTPTEIITSD